MTEDEREIEELRRLLREFCVLWAQASLLGPDQFRAAYHRFDRELRERGILPPAKHES